MPNRTRISVTLPPEVVEAADARAQALDRSRSWVVAEALRRYLAAAPGEEVAGMERRGLYVAEPAAPAYAARAVERARARHLRAEAALPVDERLRRAEELGRLARRAQGRGVRCQVIGFDSYEDFYEWKKGHRIGI